MFKRLGKTLRRKPRSSSSSSGSPATNDNLTQNEKYVFTVNSKPVFNVSLKNLASKLPENGRYDSSGNYDSFRNYDSSGSSDSSKNNKSNTDPQSINNLITVPGSIFNEVNKGAPADKPGKGSTIRSDDCCKNLFDYKKDFDVSSCAGRDVLIVSHNKRLQKLIGQMFPDFADSKKGDCPYGIANCAVIKIIKKEPTSLSPNPIYENEYNAITNIQTQSNMDKFANGLRRQNQLSSIEIGNAKATNGKAKATNGKAKATNGKASYQLTVLFDGFPDKTICQAEIVASNIYSPGSQNFQGLYEGGGDRYAYLTTNHTFEIDVDRVESGTFHEIFESDAKSIIMVRHGNGPHNKPCANKMFENPPLTALGVYQAHIAGTEMGKKKIIDLDDKKNFKIFTSQLKRAQQTTLQFLASFLSADQSAAPNGVRENKLRGISNNSFTFFRQKFLKACEKCLKRFNVDTKNIDKTRVSSKVSRRACSYQKVLYDPVFYKSKFMKENANDYNESRFNAFVIKHELANPKLIPYSELNNLTSKTPVRPSTSSNSNTGNSGYNSQSISSSVYSIGGKKTTRRRTTKCAKRTTKCAKRTTKCAKRTTKKLRK